MAATPPQAPSLGRMALAAALFVAGVAVVAALVEGPRPAPPTAAMPGSGRSDLDIARDRVATFLHTGGSRTDSLEMDGLIHGDRLNIPHDALHRRVVALRLDSAVRPHLSVGDGRAQIANLWPPLTAAQQRERDRLAARFDRQARRDSIAAASAARIDFAATAENLFLDRGMDVTVTTSGATHDQLTLKYIFAGRVLAHQLQQDPNFWANLRRLGFRRLRLTDGYDYMVYWNVAR